MNAEDDKQPLADHPDIRRPDEPVTPPWVAEMQAATEIFKARSERNRRIALWFLIPYGIAGGTAGAALSILASRVHEPRLALIIGACLAVIVFSQWGQPYFWNRPVQTSSIRQHKPPEAGSVD